MSSLDGAASAQLAAGSVAEATSARRCVMIVLALAFAVNLPLMLSNTVIGGDDWAWVWVYRSQGPAAILRYMWDAAHPGYGVIFDLFFFIGRDHAGEVAHVAAIGFHLGCGWMLWRIFREGSVSLPIAASVAMLYLAAPFLANLHSSLAHAHYDLVIFFYLLSIRLGLARGLPAIAGAIVAMIIGLTIETLVVLEPLRWWLLYRQRRNIRWAAAAALPFVVLAIAAAALRAFWLTPEGIYRGYNAFIPPNLVDYIRLAKLHLNFFMDVRQPVWFAASLVRHDNFFLVLVLAIGAGLAGRTTWHGEPHRDELIGMCIIGVIVLILGMIPYIAIDRVPTRVDVSSRYAVASQFGALMLAAAGINLLRFAPLRVSALAAVLFVFLANQLQLGKWLLYEGPIVADFRDQVGGYLAKVDDQVLVVDFVPPARDFLYVNRACLSSYDTNVSLEIAGLRHRSFVYDRACGARIYANPDGCFITGYDQPGPCPPEHRSAAFRLKADLVPFTRFRLLDLLRMNFERTPFEAGTLSIEPGQGTPQPEKEKPQ